MTDWLKECRKVTYLPEGGGRLTDWLNSKVSGASVEVSVSVDGSTSID